MRPLARAAAAAMLALASIAGIAGIASVRVAAHAEYDRSIPAANATVRAPARIEMWFTQELFRRAGANTLEVTAPDGRRVDQGDPVLDTVDRKHLSVALAGDLGPGVYTVQWHSLSAADGDEASDRFRFTVDPNAPAATSAATVAPASGASSASGAKPSGGPSLLARLPWATMGGAALLVVAAGLCWWAVAPSSEERAR